MINQSQLTGHPYKIILPLKLQIPQFNYYYNLSFVFHEELQFELMMNGDDEQIKRVKEIMDR